VSTDVNKSSAFTAYLNKLYAVGSFMLFSFFSGIMNIYVGGTQQMLSNVYHLHAPAFSELTASLFFSTGLGCVVGGTLLDRYGAGVISFIFSLVATIGLALFALNQDFLGFFYSEFIIGLGISIWYPAGMVALKYHFKPKELPFMAGVLLFFNYLGAACISIVVYTSATMGLFNTNLFVFTIAFLCTFYFYFTWSVNNTATHYTPIPLAEDYYNQLRTMRNWIALPLIIAQTIASVFSYVYLPLWSIPYLSLLLTPLQAGTITSACLIIYGLSGVILGRFYHKYFSPMVWMTLQNAISLLLFSLLIYLPSSYLNFTSVSLILYGVSILRGASSTYTATYLADLFEKRYTGTISAIYAYFFQFIISGITPVFGIILANTSQGEPFTLADYNSALQYVALAFVITTFATTVLQKVVTYYPKVIKLDD